MLRHTPMHPFAPLRLSILAALGILAGCDSTVTESGGGGSGGSGSGADGGNGGNGGNGGGPAACVDPQPIVIDGVDSGYVKCADGAIDRLEEIACGEPSPAGAACVGDELNLQCTTDADCSAQPYGRCLHYNDEFKGGGTYCGCAYGCESDADCGDGRICLCGGVTAEFASSRCVDANCTTGEDCEPEACGLAVYNDGCGAYPTLTCRSDADGCHGNLDCPTSYNCSPGSTDPAVVYVCKDENCAIGRPMTIEGRSHVAPTAAREDWSQLLGGLPLSDPRLNAALADRWTTIAALEHASVGSFARFTMQLLALGAPADLLADTQRAAADEVEHAMLAYGLASRFAGRAIGPGPIEGVGAAVPTTESEIVRALIADACIGETLGVAEAMATADLCTDQGIRRVLERVTADEQRHAELAWRTLGWMLKRNPALVTEVQGAIDSVKNLFEPGVDTVVDRERGLLSSREIVAIRRRAFDEVVRPCMRALINAIPATA